MDKLWGVNLGNWLVLEKWMDENLFSGTEAMDETYLGVELGEKVNALSRRIPLIVGEWNAQNAADGWRR